jgi:hypothetical protein
MSTDLNIVEYGSKGEGWSGSDTSKERAEREEKTGVGGWRRKQVHALIEGRAAQGMTCHEVETELGIGHGAASAALTHLHRAGFLRRLSERRNGQEVYVHPDHVNGREQAAYRPNAAYREGTGPAVLEQPDVTLPAIAQALHDEGLPPAWYRHIPGLLARLGIKVVQP